MIRNNELIGHGAPEDEGQLPFRLEEPIGRWIYKNLGDNLKKYGDMTWMVSLNYITIIYLYKLKLFNRRIYPPKDP